MGKISVLVKKEVKYSTTIAKILVIAFSIGYGVLFGLLAKLFALSMYRFYLYFMPIVLALTYGSQIIQSLSIDKNARVGEMLLTSGITMKQYIVSKLISGTIHTTIGIVLFQVIFIILSLEQYKLVADVYNWIYLLFMSAVVNILYCCLATSFKIKKGIQKSIIFAFLILACALIIFMFMNSFITFEMITDFSKMYLWLFMLLYGVICTAIAIRFLSVDAFVKK